MFERAIAIRDDGQQTLAIFGGWKILWGGG
jgi:hypothetical protein